jgi:hypothetical protein
MPELVVDPLEAVEVSHQQAERRARALHPGKLLGECLVERPPVGEARQRVGARRFLGQLFRGAQVGLLLVGAAHEQE